MSIFTIHGALEFDSYRWRLDGVEIREHAAIQKCDCCDWGDSEYYDPDEYDVVATPMLSRADEFKVADAILSAMAPSSSAPAGVAQEGLF
jgi:hypothetical protein